MIRFFIASHHKKRRFYLLLLLIFLINPRYSLPQDFKVAPNSFLPEGSNFYNASIASDNNQGFLVTWANKYYIGNVVYWRNYACRFSNSGEMLDSSIILLGESYWPNYCPSAVFAGDNWIIAFNQGGLFENTGAVRLTPSGQVLDDPPINICNSFGYATIYYPILVTNGEEIICVTGIAGKGMYGTIIDKELNILVDRFPILECDLNIAFFSDDVRPIIATNGENFFITFLLDDPYKPVIKLIIVSPKGEVLSVQNVFDNFSSYERVGLPMITTLSDITYVSYFYIRKYNYPSGLFIRRYASDGSPIDPAPIKIAESDDFNPILEGFVYTEVRGYSDLVTIDNNFYFFWPSVSDSGMLMFYFDSDLSKVCTEPTFLNSQCQIAFRTPLNQRSISLIRASSIGNNILTAWIDGREGSTRIYGNFIDISLYTGINNIEPNPVKNYLLLQNYPNPFNNTTVIRYSLKKEGLVTLKIYNAIGQEVAALVNETKQAGSYEVTFNSDNLTSGVYIYKMQTGDYISSKKMLLLK